MTPSQRLPIALGTGAAGLLTVLAGVRGGPAVATSVPVGIAVSITSMAGLTRFAKTIAEGSFGVGSGARLALIFGVMKLPVVALGLYLAVRLAWPFPEPLIASIILVYFCFVWMVRRSVA